MVGTGDLGQYFSTSGSHITAYPWINLYQYTNSGYIWGFHGSEDSIQGLLGCDTVWWCGTILENLAASIFRVKVLQDGSIRLQHYMASQPTAALCLLTTTGKCHHVNI